MRGRKPIYRDPVNISIKCERSMRDIMQSLNISDPEVYAAGAIHLAEVHAGDLSEQQVHCIIQELRQDIKDNQERIVCLERVAMDAGVRQELKRKKNIETRYDERGREYQVVIQE